MSENIDTSEEVIIGIDLGTTNSCVGIYNKNGIVDIILNEQGHKTTPSYVAFKDNERLIGYTAKENAGKNPKITIYDVKRLMGTRFIDKNIQKNMKHLTYDIVEINEMPCVSVSFKNEQKTFTPEEISSMILKKLVVMAEKYLDKKISKAVVTVPAYFNNAQREATKIAGQIIGLDIIRIINEPTAAAIAYGLDKKDERNILVYDLGGGTLDVSILTIEDGMLEVKSTSGDTHLGGEDFDQKLKDYCFMKFCDKYILKTKLNDNQKCILLKHLDLSSYAGLKSYGTQNIKQILTSINETDEQIIEHINEWYKINELYENSKLMRRLQTSCENSKRLLSTSNSINIAYDNFYDGEDLDIKISRNKFEKICEREFNKCLNPIDIALEGSSLNYSQIDDVVLVGGSTRLPKIQELLDSKFPNKLRHTINPDEAVAYGAAIQGAILNKQSDEKLDGLVLIDVTPLSLGIETLGGNMDVMIKRNTSIPIKEERTYSTHSDNQPSVTIKIFEGERAKTSSNNLLGKFDLVDIPPMPKGEPRIKITFEVDANGIMTVSAKELSKDITRNIVIKNEKNRLSPDYIQKAIDESLKYQEEDKKIWEIQEERNKLETYIRNVVKTINNDSFRDKISDEQYNMISNIINNINEWFDDIDDDDDIDMNKDDYNEQYVLLEKRFLPLLEDIHNMNHNNDTNNDTNSDNSNDIGVEEFVESDEPNVNISFS
jgi:L1 cell adhesion molecule like protein